MKGAFSTAQVARLLGINKQTLLRWLWAGKIAEPKLQSNGGQKVRLWSNHDVERVRNYKAANYRKGRGRNKKKT